MVNSRVIVYVLLLHIGQFMVNITAHRAFEFYWTAMGRQAPWGCPHWGWCGHPHGPRPRHCSPWSSYTSDECSAGQYQTGAWQFRPGTTAPHTQLRHILQCSFCCLHLGAPQSQNQNPPPQFCFVSDLAPGPFFGVRSDKTIFNIRQRSDSHNIKWSKEHWFYQTNYIFSESLNLE